MVCVVFHCGMICSEENIEEAKVRFCESLYCRFNVQSHFSYYPTCLCMCKLKDKLNVYKWYEFSAGALPLIPK